MAQDVVRLLRNAGLKPELLPPGTKVDGRPVEEFLKPEQKSRIAPYRSKTELQWSLELELRQKAGRVLWWAYEPVTLVIADARGNRCRYTPDFMVVYKDSPRVVFYEVKGFCREAARIRFLAARERYPFWDFYVVKKGKRGQWVVTEYI